MVLSRSGSVVVTSLCKSGQRTRPLRSRFLTTKNFVLVRYALLFASQVFFVQSSKRIDHPDKHKCVCAILPPHRRFLHQTKNKVVRQFGSLTPMSQRPCGTRSARSNKACPMRPSCSTMPGGAPVEATATPVTGGGYIFGVEEARFPLCAIGPPQSDSAQYRQASSVGLCVLSQEGRNSLSRPA